MQVGGGPALTEECSTIGSQPVTRRHTAWPPPPHGHTHTHTHTHTHSPPPPAPPAPGNAGGASLRPRANSHSRRWPARQVEPLTCCHC